MWDEDDGVPGAKKRSALWLAGASWIRTAFPDLAERRRQLLLAVDVHLQAGAPALARATRAILGSALADLPGVHHDSVALLIRRLSEIRQIGDTPELQLVHCLIAALDACTPSIDDHSLLAGVRAAGWVAVPSPLVDVVVALALALLQWRGGPGRELRESAAGLLDFQSFEVQLHRLAGAAAEQSGAPPGLAWIREAPAGPATPRIVRAQPPAAAYLAAVLRVVSPDDARPLPLLEAYADACAAGEVKIIEAVVLSLARRSGAGEGDCLLRAALRAWRRGDDARAEACGEAAFFAGEDPVRRQTAAALLGLLRLGSDRQAARAWWLTAAALSGDPGDKKFLAVLRGFLGDPAESLESCFPDRPELRELLESMRRHPEAVASVPTPPKSVGEDGELREVWTSLAGEDLFAAYQRFSEVVAQVTEAYDAGEAAARLEARRVKWMQVMQGIAPDPELRIDARVLMATLTGWLCGALADLHDHAGDHEQWCKYKRRQLALEDQEGAAPEGTQNDAAAWVLIVVGERCFDLTARARHCIEEAQDALADGRSDRARFWTERASDYRARLRRSP